MAEGRFSDGDRGLVIGRSRELELGEHFVTGEDVSRALLIEGEAGIGKTVVWRELVAIARARGVCVLSASPTVPESEFAFSALGDLLGPVLDSVGPALQGPRRAALERALWLSEPQASSALSDPRAIGLGVLDTLRELSRDRRVVLAIDDVQWLDGPSVSALTFALRRLDELPVALLLTRRLEQGDLSLPSLIEALDRDRLAVLKLGPLSLGAIGHVLRAHVEGALSRPTVRRAHSVSRGNPLFAIELVGSLREQRLALPDAPPELSLTLRGLLGERLAGLSRPARRVALVTSALAQARVHTVLRAAGDAAAREGLASAVDADVLVVRDSRVEFTHPLLASVVYGEASPAERRELHERLAAAVEDPEERARHLIAVTVAPDAVIAEVVEEAAVRARARGAPDVAAQFAQRAVSLTPEAEVVERCGRLILAGRFAFAAGEGARAAELLARAVDEGPTGAARADALLELARVGYDRDGVAAVREVAERALAEAAGDPLLEARALATLAETNSEDYDEAVDQATGALARLSDARVTDPRTEASALKALALAKFYGGRGLDLTVLERAGALERRAPETQVQWRAKSLLGELLERACRFGEARPLLEGSYHAAVEEGDEGAVPDRAAWLCELELAVGRWTAALEWADVVADAAERSDQVVWGATAEGMRARILAHLGQVEPARAGASRSLSITGLEIPGDHALAALGLLELSLGNLEEAEDGLARLDELANRVSLREPSAWRYEADRIEALIGLDRLDQAGALLESLEARAGTLVPSWALATSGRCRGLLLAAEGETDAALSALRSALEEHERLAMPFECARTLLVLGATERRAKQRGAARRTLQKALTTFEALGASIWIDRTRAELARIGGRAAAGAALTPTEQRVAELAATGRSNKAIAAELYVSVHTVEANLTRIYAKLGVHSRGELAHRLGSVARKM